MEGDTKEGINKVHPRGLPGRWLFCQICVENARPCFRQNLMRMVVGTKALLLKGTN